MEGIEYGASMESKTRKDQRHTTVRLLIFILIVVTSATSILLVFAHVYSMFRPPSFDLKLITEAAPEPDEQQHGRATQKAHYEQFAQNVSRIKRGDGRGESREKAVAELKFAAHTADAEPAQPQEANETRDAFGSFKQGRAAEHIVKVIRLFPSVDSKTGKVIDPHRCIIRRWDLDTVLTPQLHENTSSEHEIDFGFYKLTKGGAFRVREKGLYQIHLHIALNRSVTDDNAKALIFNDDVTVVRCQGAPIPLRGSDQTTCDVTAVLRMHPESFVRIKLEKCGTVVLASENQTFVEFTQLHADTAET